MKTRLLLFFALLISVTLLAQTPVGLWKFDNATSPLTATTGSDLVSNGELGVGYYPVDGPVAGNGAIHNDPGNFLALTHGINPNGGGTKVNQYSIKMDFMVTTTSNYNSFWQTGAVDDGDGDLWIKGNATIGVTAITWSTNTVSTNTWYRLVFTFDGSNPKFYINGELWGENTDAGYFDGRFALSPVMSIFADDDWEALGFNCSELAVYNVTLDASQVAALGDATTTAANEEFAVSLNSKLGQNYPNPFSNETEFKYQVNNSSDVTFKVIDLSGREVATFDLGNKAQGDHTFVLNADNLNSGVYFVKMTANNEMNYRRIIISK